MRLTGVAAIVAFAGMASSSVNGQYIRFRSGVDLVRVDALVTEDRRIVTGLLATDFELRDNGVLQTIDAIALEAMPLTLTFVLDTSGSVDGGKMADLTSAVDIILRGLAAQDRVGLITFSHRLWQRLPLSSDVELVRRVLAEARGAGGTSLNDAVYAGLALGESQEARSLVLVFSDGLDNSSWLPRTTVERAARRADAVVYGVVVAGGAQAVIDVGQGRSVRFRPEYLPGQTDFLEAVASETGGRVIKADDTVRLPKVFDEILQEFRTRYVITYSPSSNAPGWHTIDVKVKGRRAEVTARRGYERTQSSREP